MKDENYYRVLLREWSDYYRSYSVFERNVKRWQPDIACLRAFGSIVEAFQLETCVYKQRFRWLFFEGYGELIAGSCGCSGLLFDHQRIPVVDNELFTLFLNAMYRADVFACSPRELARAIDLSCVTKYTEERLKQLIREPQYRDDELIKIIMRLPEAEKFKKRGLF